MSRTKFDGILRSALWNAYQNKCFYCSKDLEFLDINIDHIIPEHYDRKKEQFDKIKKDYLLPLNFDVNEPYNLVPTHSKCNNRKSGHLFEKVSTLFFLELAKGKLTAVQKEIELIKARKSKGQLLSKLHTALQTNLIDINELEKLTTEAKLAVFKNKEIKLDKGFEFMDAVYDSFYLDADLSQLYEKKLLINSEDEGLEVINSAGEKRLVATLKEWEVAVESDFFPSNTYSIKMAANFTYLESFLNSVKTAQMPKYSFISEPWVSLTDLDILSPIVIQDFESQLKPYIDVGTSVGDLIKLGIIKRNHSEYFELALEFNGIETYLSEQFRADFNGDGFEDIFLKGWVRAIGGTMGFGFNTILSRHSARELLNVFESSNVNVENFKLTLWCDTKNKRTAYFIQNDGEEPIFDAVFYVDKLGKTEEEMLRSKHSFEIVFGTVPPKTSLSHLMEDDDEQNVFGFPVFSGEFTSKNAIHYSIDRLNNVSVIPYRSSFD